MEDYITGVKMMVSIKSKDTSLNLSKTVSSIMRNYK